MPNGICVIYSWCDTGLVEPVGWFWVWMLWPSGGNCDLSCSLDCLLDMFLPPQVALNVRPKNLAVGNGLIYLSAIHDSFPFYT